MSLEEKLISWTKPSSDTEQEKQERTERMIREAISSHRAFDGCNLEIYAKGSYANNTNVRSDSDVDIAVECTEVFYWEKAEEIPPPIGAPYTGVWTPDKLREELVFAMEAEFGEQVDPTGSTAIQINSSSARVDADVVPCFTYRYYMETGFREGTAIFKKDGSSLVNYPKKQLENGRIKNNRTNHSYKKGARLLKRIENEMAEKGLFRELPSYFMECLAYNCPDEVFMHETWTECLKAMLRHIFKELQDDEPVLNRWVEVNEYSDLFHADQEWSRKDGREFAKIAWNYLGLKNAKYKF
ncbi:nucleotidyltransferase [Wohlfahrtiimonas chitiniclastica]|uniref:nucleotidyltransferase domain-containing protein n=1 Tax=Wohlfahrtiimonas chitiniclastica TaxID=400946 RepID=UPI000B99145A|nr:nucleotidyltransferase [Wohlfahrtiimonas chitiniclastica]OYQ89092.1 nucleotidyltransferase [Wohlfahrtiimonas chitiniclastica]